MSIHICACLFLGYGIATSEGMHFMFKPPYTSCQLHSRKIEPILIHTANIGECPFSFLNSELKVKSYQL